MTDAGHKLLLFIFNKAAPALLLACCVLFALAVRADTPATAVLYPEIREPFRSVFTSIADGVGQSLEGRILQHAISNEESVEDIDAWLKQHQVQTTVVLGSRSRELSDRLSGTLPVVIGGVHMSDDLIGDGYLGIALNPDPAMLLRRLKSLAPGVQRVHVVYHREREQWIIDRSLDSATAVGIELNPIPVDRLQEAANRYLEVLQTQHSDSEALWLSQDSAVLDEQAVLPMILREAWDRKLIVFSSNPSHVRRGVLFALYPDNHGMGQSLGEIAMEIHRHVSHQEVPAPSGMRMLDRLLIAFNVRTAGRLGIRYSRDDITKFDLVFPPL